MYIERIYLPAVMYQTGASLGSFDLFCYLAPRLNPEEALDSTKGLPGTCFEAGLDTKCATDIRVVPLIEEMPQNKVVHRLSCFGLGLVLSQPAFWYSTGCSNRPAPGELRAETREGPERKAANSRQRLANHGKTTFPGIKDHHHGSWNFLQIPRLI